MDNFLWSMLGAIVMFFVTSFITRANDTEDEIIAELKADIKELSIEMKQLSKELTKFGALVERLDEKTEGLPKLREDLNLLWAKVKTRSGA